jgi:phage recombination protein Bet
MINEVQKSNDVNVDMWHNETQLKEIRSVYAKGATDTEFQTFVQMGRATGLNPFLREIWFVKYNQKDANIFIGRDGYRKTANRDKNYMRHHAEAIYTNDKFKYDANTGKVFHDYDFKDRGNLYGAYCLVFMRNNDIPFYKFVLLSEYDLKQSVWVTKKATMIEKVAEVQCLRMACPELFGGTYDESEQYHVDSKANAKTTIDEMIKTKVQNTKEFREINKVIRNAEKLSDLDIVPEMVKGMTDINNEVQTIRQLYKLKKDKLKKLETETVDSDTGEIIDVESEDITDDVKPPSEYDKIKGQLIKAKTIDILDVAGDLIRSLDNDDERDELSRMYVERKEELKG